jgi:hypothetical protein
MGSDRDPLHRIVGTGDPVLWPLRFTRLLTGQAGVRMTFYDVLLGLTLFAIGGLGVCVGYAIAQRDRKADIFFVDEPQRDPYPDSFGQQVIANEAGRKIPGTYSTTLTYPLNKAQYEAELDKPDHTPGEYNG